MDLICPSTKLESKNLMDKLYMCVPKFYYNIAITITCFISVARQIIHIFQVLGLNHLSFCS